MKHRRNLILGFGGMVLIVAVMIGCAPSPAAPISVQSGAGADDLAESDFAVEEMAEEPALEYASTAPAPAAAPADAVEAERAASGEEAPQEVIDTTGQDQDPLVSALPQDRMIIKNAEMVLLVESADTAINRVTQIAVDNGGYVLSSQTWFSGEYKYATVSIAVRSDQFERAMDRLRQIALEVRSESASGQDVTSEFVDLESRVRNLEATRDRIKSFLENAKTTEEALQINQQLTEIEAQIEQVKGRMAYLSGRAAFSTITVNLEVPQPTPTPTFTPSPTSTPTNTPTPTQWSPGLTLNNATRTQTNLFQGLVEVLIWIVVVPGPYLLGIALVAAGVRTYQLRRGNGKNGGNGSGGSSAPPPAAP